MLKIGSPKYQAGFTTFKWGIYIQLRTGYSWRHVKIGGWVQRGLRVSTRRQVKTHHRKPRYVKALRFNVSYWSSSKGIQGRPMNFGAQVYWGRNPKG